MTTTPIVDVNMMVFNNVATVAATIESVLRQTWPAVSLTVIDNASTDGTFELLQSYAASYPGIRVRRNRCNTGPGANIQRAFWWGNADFVMPKTSDDMTAPHYIEKLMGELLAHPDCAMCHAAGLVFSGDEIKYLYPREHCLQATGPDPVARARHVMWHYTSAPSFWGVYRRDAVDQLSAMRYRAGSDHSMLAELALYGEVRHVAEPLYWRRDGGKPVSQLARASTEQGNRGLSVDTVLADQRWRTPLVTTAYTHMETFAAARLSLPQRQDLLNAVPEIFRGRWLPLMQREAANFRAELPNLLGQVRAAEPVTGRWLAHMLAEVILGLKAILPEEGFDLALLEGAANQEARQ
ncbi:MAG: glycosyltransferase family 2 protein [Rhodopila sp.]